MIEPGIDGDGEHEGIKTRSEHRRGGCRGADCPLDSAGKCAEHGLIRWILGLLVVVGLIVTGFSWDTSSSVRESMSDVGESIAKIDRAMAVVVFAQQTNTKALATLLSAAPIPESFLKQFERLEDRVNILERQGHSITGEPDR